MGLGSGEWLLGDSRGTNDAYCPVLTIHILTALQRVTVAVGNSGRDIHNVILDVRRGGVDVRDVMMSGRSGCICGRCECLLGAGSQQLLSPRRQNAR